MAVRLLDNNENGANTGDLKIAPQAKRVIVFGASGFIGSNFCRHLRELTSLEVIGYSSSECNMLDQSQVAKALGDSSPGTSVVLCSAITPRKEDSWSAMLKNVEMAHNLCEGIPSTGLRSVIYMSSVDVYGARIPSDGIREDTEVDPKSYYALSKLVCEALLRIELPDQCPLTILRIPGIYGPGDQSQSVLGGFINKILRQETIKITGEGTTKRDYVNVADLCHIVEQFLDSPFAGVVNVATGSSIAIKDLVETAAKVVGLVPTVEFEPATRADKDMVFETSRLMSLQPALRFMDLERGIAEYESYLCSTDETVRPGS